MIQDSVVFSIPASPHAQGIECLESALELCRVRGCREGMAAAHNNLGCVHNLVECQARRTPAPAAAAASITTTIITAARQHRREHRLHPLTFP